MESDSTLRKKKRQKQEKDDINSNYSSSNSSLYSDLNCKPSIRDTNFTSNINIVHSIARSQINGRYEQRGNQLISNRINDKGFSYSSNLLGHWGCVNALDFSRGDGKYLCSGSDDKRVLLWELFKPKPTPVISLRGHLSNIFCTIFTHSNRFILSCGNDDLIIRYDLEKPPDTNSKDHSISPLQMFTRHGAAVYKVSAMPESDEIFLSASEDASIRLWDARSGTSPVGLIPGVSPYQGVDFHPRGTYFVTSNTTYGVELWDIRTMAERTFRRPKAVISYDTCGYKDVTTAVFNKRGDKLVATVRKLFPMVFETHSPMPHSVYYDPNYRNKCTMKSCVFMGANDEYVIGGSDDFNLYIWQVISDEMSHNAKIEELLKGKHIGVYQNEKPKQVLSGPRSIVNNVKYHPRYPLLASSGVEKLIKLWSPFPITNDEPIQSNTRPLFKNSDYTALFQDFDFIDQGSDDERNTEESSKTLALFDFFNQYEITSSDDDWENDDDIDSDPDEDLEANADSFVLQ